MLKEIKIGCYDYEIEYTKDAIINNNKKCLGEINYLNNKIKISIEDGISNQSQEQTLWHEIVHGIINYRNVSYGADEETFVDELATGLYLLCKNNGLLPGQKVG